MGLKLSQKFPVRMLAEPCILQLPKPRYFITVRLEFLHLTLVKGLATADAMYLVQASTSVPAPKVLAWSADASNPVGAEYIIMEKAPGIQLFKVWANISAVDRLGLIKKLTQLEKQLASIHFPAYGSLYFRHSILIDSERVLLD